MTTTFSPLPFILLLLFSVACQKDDSDKDNLSLTATREAVNKNEITLNWSLSRHDDFVKYHLVSSPNANLSDEIIPVSYSSFGTIKVYIFTDQTIQQYTDDAYKPGFDLYYKLYVEREDGKVVSSPTIKVSPIKKLLDIEYYHSAEIPGTTHLAISSLEGGIIKYDYAQDTILSHNISEELKYAIIRIGDAGNGMELFVTNGNKIYVLDINSFFIKSVHTFHFGIYDITISPKGVLFASQREVSGDNYIYSIRRADWELRDSILTSSSLNKSLKIVNANDSTLFYFTIYHFQSHTFNSDGFFTGVPKNGNISPAGYLKNDVSVSPSGSYLIATEQSPVVDNQLNIVRLISDIDSPFHTFENEETVYLYHPDERSLVLYNLFTRDYTILYSHIIPQAVYRTENQIIVLGYNSDNGDFKTEVLVLDK